MTQINEALLAQMDHAIKTGQGRVARRILRGSDLGGVSRTHRATLANIARRADLSNLAVSLLNPLIRPSLKKRAHAATDVEKAEYAAALTNIGASDEAIEVLEGIDSNRTPVALLYHSFALFGSWDYESAIPLLERYIRSSTLSEYESLVGKVNLAAAFVHVRKLEHAEPILAELREVTQRQGQRLLLGNTLEIWAQGAIRGGDWKSAERLLSESRTALASSESLGEFFVKKWEMILAAHRSKNATPHLKGFSVIKREAIQRQHWETLRDLDFVAACISRDARTALHVYAGTPFAPFRKRLLSEIPFSLDIPVSYSWRPDAKARPTQQINLIDGKDRGQRQLLEVGQVMHRLLRILSSDFYRPLRLPTLFSRLYPDEYYDPVNSPVRIHQAMKRLRIWIGEAGLPLLIKESNGFYSLTGQRVEVIVPTGSGEGAIEGLVAQKLKASFRDDTFTTQDVCRALGLTERTAQRVLRQLRSEDLVSKIGKGRASSYRF